MPFVCNGYKNDMLQWHKKVKGTDSMRKRYFTFLLLLIIAVVIAACDTNNDSDDATEPPDTAVAEVVDEATVTPEPTATDEPMEETDEVIEPEETELPIETEAPVETAEAMETEDPDATPEVDETPEVIDLGNPLPNITDDGSFIVIPSRAEIADSVAVNDSPEGYRWVMATVTLSNQSESTQITVEADDISLIGDDAQRYSPQEMAERVSPALVGSTLDAEESVIGFALFAMPEDVEPALFEWCPTGDCSGTRLQAEIVFNE